MKYYQLYFQEYMKNYRRKPVKEMLPAWKIALNEAERKLNEGKKFAAIFENKEYMRRVELALDIVLANTAGDLQEEGLEISEGWTLEESMLILGRLSSAHISMLDFIVQDRQANFIYTPVFIQGVKTKNIEVLFDQILIQGEEYGS